MKDVAAKLAERELFGKERFKRNVTISLMKETLKDGEMRRDGPYSYAFHYLISRSEVPVNFATTHNFKGKKMGVVSVLAKGSVNTVYTCVFGYEYKG